MDIAWGKPWEAHRISVGRAHGVLAISHEYPVGGPWVAHG